MRNEPSSCVKRSSDRRCWEEIVGSSPALRRVLTQVEKVAATDSTVLISARLARAKN